MQKKIILVFFLGLLGLLVGGKRLPAKEPTIKDQTQFLNTLVTKLQERYDTLTSFTADFQQEYISSIHQGKRQLKGRIWSKKPGILRWIYTEPIKKFFLIKNNTMILGYPEDEQVEIFSDFKMEQYPGALAFFLGQGKIKEQYQVQLLGQSTQSVQLKLKPKKEMGTLKHLQVMVSRKDHFIHSIKIIDRMGNINQVTFSALKLNPAIGKEIFEYKIPHGYEVIKH